MILISKKEAMELHKMGVRYKDGGISHTYSNDSRKKYYLCESPYNMSRLNRIREGAKG